MNEVSDQNEWTVSEWSERRVGDGERVNFSSFRSHIHITHSPISLSLPCHRELCKGLAGEGNERVNERERSEMKWMNGKARERRDRSSSVPYSPSHGRVITLPSVSFGACHLFIPSFFYLWTGQMGVWWDVFPFVQPHSPIYHLFILSERSISRVSELMLDKNGRWKRPNIRTKFLGGLAAPSSQATSELEDRHGDGAKERAKWGREWQPRPNSSAPASRLGAWVSEWVCERGKSVVTEERVGWSEFTSGVCVDVCGLVKGMNCKTHTPSLYLPCPVSLGHGHLFIPSQASIPYLAWGWRLVGSHVTSIK